jgi:RNA polymerase sigma-70 factor (ECF subfamily)
VDNSDVAEMCRRYGSSILRRCRAILRDPATAEDAAQEVFVAIMGSANRFRGESDLGTWIYRITTNLCLNHLRSSQRRAAREHAASALDAPPGDPYRAYEARAKLAELARTLDPLSLEILVLHQLDGLTQDEIAAVTGRSRRTIGKKLKAIQRHLGGEP